MDCIYWATYTIATVGYKNFNAPQDPYEVGVSIVVMFLGGIYFSILISVISNIVYESLQNHV